MKGGPTDPPNGPGRRRVRDADPASMKGGPTDPPNECLGVARVASPPASMKGGPTDPPNWRNAYPYRHVS